MTHVHVIGICGTFMGGVAKLATELGFQVSGCDSQVYPPMSEQLSRIGVELRDGYLPQHLTELRPDQIIIGNALSRGNPLVETVLNDNLPYCSGPEWLAREVLKRRWVLAVAGTHGKTTTSSLLTWILDQAGMEPGFLIGGVPENFGISARLGGGSCFVVEADEYDTAFFDKRSKFVHYHPLTLILNNLEYDHADIFNDLDAIIRQFHHLVRTVPGKGRIIANGEDNNINKLIKLGCWTPIEWFGRNGFGYDWSVELPRSQADEFRLKGPECVDEQYEWQLMAEYNVLNAAAALAAAYHVGVRPGDTRSAIRSFRSVKRRMQKVTEVNGVTMYDDFAHHPTAVRQTLAALRHNQDDGRIICIFEPRSNTMRMGVQIDALREALTLADRVLVYQSPEVNWDARELENESVVIVDNTAAIIEYICRDSRPGDRIVIMSNGGFENLTQRLLDRLTH